MNCIEEGEEDPVDHLPLLLALEQSILKNSEIKAQVEGIRLRN